MAMENHPFIDDFHRFSHKNLPFFGDFSIATFDDREDQLGLGRRRPKRRRWSWNRQVGSIRKAILMGKSWETSLGVPKSLGYPNSWKVFHGNSYHG